MDQLDSSSYFRNQIKHAHAKYMPLAKITNYESWLYYITVFNNIIRASSHVVTACKLDFEEKYLLHAGFTFADRTTLDLIHLVHESEWKGLRPAAPIRLQVTFITAKSYDNYLTKLKSFILEKKLIPIYSYYRVVANEVYLIEIFNFADDLYQICTVPDKTWDDLPEEIKNLIC